MRPHNLPLVLLGAGLLWFGWFGFNAGSAVAANGLAGIAFMNTQVATAAAAMAWIVTEKLRDGKSTTLGVASGAVAGLVAITPACGSVSPMGAIGIGIVAGVLCCLAVGLKFRYGFDDSLDVVGVHLVGGVVGTVLIGFVSTSTAPGGIDGLFYGGGLTQLGMQAIAAGAVLAYSFVVSYILAQIVQKTIGFRITEEEEVNGIDQSAHAETGYDFASTFGGGFASSGPRTVDVTSEDRSVKA